MAEEFLKIEDDRVSLYNRRGDGEVLERQVDLTTFLKEVFLTATVWEGPVLPVGTRWYARGGKREFLVVEEPPRVRRLTVNPRGGLTEEETRHLRLAFPYLVYLMSFLDREPAEVKLFFRTGNLASPDDRLLFPSLPNVQYARGHRAEGRACLRPWPRTSGLELAGKVETLLSHFWSTGFNLDVEDNCLARAQALSPVFSSLDSWEEATRQDPLFVLDVAWEESGLTPRSVMTRVFSDLAGAFVVSEPSRLADITYRLPDLRSRSSKP